MDYEFSEIYFEIIGNDTYLYAQGNQITSLDLSQNTQLNIISCENNLLYRLNVKNGNNTNVTQFFTTGNPSLECINVDDSTYSANNWTNIDSQQYFGESCFCSIVINSQTNVSCFGGFDGSLVLSGYGGSGAYNYTFGLYNAFFDSIFSIANTGTGYYSTPFNLANSLMPSIDESVPSQSNTIASKGGFTSRLVFMNMCPFLIESF